MLSRTAYLVPLGRQFHGNFTGKVSQAAQQRCPRLRSSIPYFCIHQTPKRDFSYNRRRPSGDNKLAKQYTLKIRNAPSWEAFLALTQDMRRNGVEMNVIHFSAAIAVCAKYRKTEEALLLLAEMIYRGIEPNVISYSSAISACANGNQWEKAVHLLQEMTQHWYQAQRVQLQFRDQCMRERKAVGEGSPSPARNDRPWHRAQCDQLQFCDHCM